MTNRLDIVAIRIEHERAVVVGVIVRANARRAIVLAAAGQRGHIERVHLGARRRQESDVGWRRLQSVRRQPEFALVVLANADDIDVAGEALGDYERNAEPKRRQGFDIERLRTTTKITTTRSVGVLD